MASMFASVLKNEHVSTPALYFEKKSISYPELIGNIRKMITCFRRLGLRSGDTVTVALPNIPASVYALYALDAIGAIQNIIHPLSPISRVIETAKETDSRLTLVLSTRLKEDREAIENCSVRFAFANPMYDRSFAMRTLCKWKFGSVPKSDRLFDLDAFRKERMLGEPTERDTSLPCIYLHSGGTTAAPKIIELSDDALNHLVSKVDGIVDGDLKGKSILTVLPAFHGFGLGMGIHTSLYWGATCALMTKFNAEKTVCWINEGKVNFILGVPLLYQKLMRVPGFASAKLEYLECAFVGGDRVPQSLIENFNRLMREKGSSCLMLEGYGLTETVTVCNVNTARDFKKGSVGKPLRDITVTVRDENEQTVPPLTVGEVYITGDTMMNGYRGDPVSTENTLRVLDGTTWVRSGDLGYLDEDGFLFLKGRKKRVYKIAGVNVYPTEVEKIATELEEDVVDAALAWFETPKPHLVLFLIRSRNAKLGEEEIRKILFERMERNLMKYCIPQTIVFTDAFPKTAVGKIDYKLFKDPTHSEKEE